MDKNLLEIQGNEDKRMDKQESTKYKNVRIRGALMNLSVKKILERNESHS